MLKATKANVLKLIDEYLKKPSNAEIFAVKLLNVDDDLGVKWVLTKADIKAVLFKFGAAGADFVLPYFSALAHDNIDLLARFKRAKCFRVVDGRLKFIDDRHFNDVYYPQLKFVDDESVKKIIYHEHWKPLTKLNKLISLDNKQVKAIFARVKTREEIDALIQDCVARKEWNKLIDLISGLNESTNLTYLWHDNDYFIYSGKTMDVDGYEVYLGTEICPSTVWDFKRLVAKETSEDLIKL